MRATDSGQGSAETGHGTVAARKLGCWLHNGRSHGVGLGVTADFTEWVTARGPRLVGFGYLLCRDRDLAQDLAQEALARLHVHWRSEERRVGKEWWFWWSGWW